jgi:hypothetical protein
VKNGFGDLLVTVSGRGALSFDGKKYPASPGDEGAKVEDGDELLFAEPTPPFVKKEELQGITSRSSARTPAAATPSPSPRPASRPTTRRSKWTSPV